MEPGLTSVNILDYTLTKHINFEADIHLPEDEGVVQVETFGVSVNADGTIFYGMQVRFSYTVGRKALGLVSSSP